MQNKMQIVLLALEILLYLKKIYNEMIKLLHYY